MTGTQRSSSDLDPRRRRALLRSWRRGMREVDLILGQFADREIGRLSEAELDEYEELMDVSDAELLKWITGAEPVPAERDTPLFRKLLDSRRTMEF